MEAKVYDQSGKKSGTVALPEAVFETPWNADLVHQVVVTMEANARTPVAHTKDRSEVRGGGKKPWRQKGTGRARHGSSRSPIWTGGGVTHGPRNEKNYGGKVNKKQKAKALFAVLAEKYRQGELLFVDNFKVSEPKTKDAKAMIDALAKVEGFESLANKKNNAAYIAAAELSPEMSKSFGNFGNMAVEAIQEMNPVKLLKHKYVIIVGPEESLKFIESKLA